MTSSSSSPSPSSSSASPLLCVSSELSASALSTSLWRFESWLSAFPLSGATVLDYFKHSPFYDLHCNNERAAGALQQLRAMEGVEFEVDSSAASPTASATASAYFLIRRQWRSSPSSVHLLQLFYVVGVDSTSAPSLPRGSVVPLPSFSFIAQCALNAALTSLNTAIHIALSSAQRQRDGAQETQGTDGEEGARGKREGIAAGEDEGSEEEEGEEGEAVAAGLGEAREALRLHPLRPARRAREEWSAADGEGSERGQVGDAGGGVGGSVAAVAAGSARPPPPSLSRPLLAVADDALRRVLSAQPSLHHSAAQADAGSSSRGR